MSRCQPQASDVFSAMNPVMAWPAKRDEVRRIEPALDVASPRIDMVRMQAAADDLRGGAMNAAIAVAFEYRAHNLLPFAGRVQALTFWCASIPVVRIERSGSPRHAVRIAPQKWLGHGCFRAKSSARFGGMGFPCKGVDHARTAHVVVFPGKVLTARPRRDSEVFQFLVDTLRVAPNQGSNLIGRQPLDFVFLTKPVGIEMGRFFGHASILNGVA